jgi:hypothetical protein
MSPTHFYDFLKDNNFTVCSTGGGCTAWVRELPQDQRLLISQDLSHEIDVELLDDNWLGIQIGIFGGEDWTDTDQNSTHATIESAINTIEQLLSLQN